MDHPVIPSDLFGRPRQGLRRYRIPILDWSLIDTAATFMAARLMTRNAWGFGSIAVNFIALLAAGHVFHRLAGLDLY